MRAFGTLILAMAVLFFTGCGPSKSLGDKVKEPFDSGKYESNKRYWRAVGKGDSRDDVVAENKADLMAKKEIAQQINTRMKVVTDQYFSDLETDNSGEFNDRFQSLVREVTNTNMADLMKIGEEKYYNAEEEKYTVYVAYEVHKKRMLRYMKKYAKADAKYDKQMIKSIEEIIDRELEELEEQDPEGN